MGTTERRLREKERRRNGIIEAAEKVFFRKGFDNASMDEVAAEAELSKGTLYLYFPNKYELEFAIGLRGFEILAGKLKRAIRRKNSGAENLLSFARAYIRFSAEFPDYFRTIVRFESSHIEEITEDQKQHILDRNFPLRLLVNVLEQGKSDHTIRNDIPSMELAVILWSQLTGTLQFILYKPDAMKMLGFRPRQMLLNHFRTIQDGIIRNITLIE